MRRNAQDGGGPSRPVRRLVISDLHFGSGDELAHHRVALERLAPQLAWADELLVNGDLFELVFGPLHVAVERSRPFFAPVNRLSPLDDAPSTDAAARWRFYNSGSWMWDRRLREHPGYRETSWPGTVLRVCGADVELVALLADLGERDLGAMVPVRPPVALVRRPHAPSRQARGAARAAGGYSPVAAMISAMTSLRSVFAS